MTKSKIVSLAQISHLASKLKEQGKRIVLCHGVFDLVHPGHIRHFTSARKMGDILVVSVTADKFVRKGPGRPIFKEELRAEVLEAIGCIDYIVIVHSESAIPAIRKIKPDFYVKGPDYKNRKVKTKIPRKLEAEEQAVVTAGGKLVFTSDPIIFSSSRLINDYLDTFPAETKEFLQNLRSDFSEESILEKISNTAKLKVLILGDAIIDEYVYCRPLGKSSKEPIIVNQFIDKEEFLGGALATANHLASLIDEVTLVSVLGKKRTSQELIRKKIKSNIRLELFTRRDSSTIVKRRFVDAYTKQKVFQISYIKDDLLPHDIEKEVLSFLKNHLKSFDLVIVNDYGHGMITPKIVKVVCRLSKYLALNVQANSANYGFNIITSYPKADYICIDENEIRLATHDKHSDLTKLIKRIYHKLGARLIMVTRGLTGAMVYSKEEGVVIAPSLTDKVVDRVGAGDAFFAISAPFAYQNNPAKLVSFLGNVAGALQVQTMGNKKPIELSLFTKFISRLLK